MVSPSGAADSSGIDGTGERYIDQFYLGRRIWTQANLVEVLLPLCYSFAGGYFCWIHRTVEEIACGITMNIEWATD
jgi:hypothetical protein